MLYLVIPIGLLVAGLCALAFANYQRDIRKARERISVGSQIFKTPCGQIEYAVMSEIVSFLKLTEKKRFMPGGNMKQ